MSFVEMIPVGQLLLDEENPRLAVVQKGQDRALDAMAKAQGTKLRYIAEDIVEHGLDPSYRLIVMPDKVRSGHFVVLDGNRRLAAIRTLEDPETVAGSVSARVLSVLRALSPRYQESPIHLVDCLVVAERHEADHWIELRHTGQHRGAGVVGWAAGEANRFRARRSGRPDLATQALDLLEQRGDLSPEARGKVPASTLGRLLGTREVRRLLGFTVRDGQFLLADERDEAAGFLRRVVDDLSSRRVGVGDLYTSDARVAYAGGLIAPAHEPEGVDQEPLREREGRAADAYVSPPPVEPLAEESLASGSPLIEPAPATQPSVPTAELPGTHTTTHAAPEAGGATARPPRGSVFAGPPRALLVPPSPKMNVTDQRLRAIARELKELPLAQFPNSNAVLFRVFLELSADDYLDRGPLTGTNERSSLRDKIKAITKDLLADGRLTEQQAQPVRRAIEAAGYEGISPLLMHQWVHNRHMFPSVEELRTGWDNFQPWLSAVWPVATNAGSASE